MKILNVTVLIDPVLGGGTAERTVQMSQALSENGVDCSILTTDVGLTEERVLSLRGVNLVVLRCILKRYFIFIFSVRKLRKLLSGVDIVHLMGHWSFLNVLIYLIARATKTPYVICPAGELNIFGRSKIFKRVFNCLIGYRIVKDSAGYIAVTKDELPVYAKYGVSSAAVTVIPNGVHKLDDYEELNSEFNFPYILFMGRLNQIKGPDLLLEAFILIAKKNPQYHLIFAGPDGGSLNSLKEYISKLTIKNRVHFIGYVTGQRKLKLYKNAEFLVIPSRHDAQSIVVLEAGICGTPVLLTRTCGFDEAAKVGGGIVVEPNVLGLKKGLLRMLKDENNLSEMGANLKFFVQENYAWESISLRYIRMYENILNARKLGKN